MTIRARFGSTVCALVTHGLGIAVIDEFTLAADNWPKIRALDIAEPTVFQTYIVHRKDVRAVELRRAICRRFARLKWRPSQRGRHAAQARRAAKK